MIFIYCTGSYQTWSLLTRFEDHKVVATLIAIFIQIILLVIMHCGKILMMLKLRKNIILQCRI